MTSHLTWVEVDLSAIQSNVRQMKPSAPTRRWPRRWGSARACISRWRRAWAGRSLPKEAVEFTRAVSALEGVEVEGFFTHFARADEIDLSSARAQLAKFERVLGGLSAAGLRPPLIHSANSAATLTLPEARYDLVRCGVAI